MVKRKTVAVIPARYGSTRFPGKVLADLGGKPIIQHVYEKAKASIADEVYVAVDDEKVKKAVEAFGGLAVMTKPEHPSGTDRIREAVQGVEADVIINIQGDEPLIPVSVIDELIQRMTANSDIEMGTVAVPCGRNEVADNPNVVKVILDNAGYALYFSRSMLPFLRDGGEETEVLRHWGIYAYRRDILDRFVTLPEGRLEKCEKLEQLRALENGIRIMVLKSNLESIGIDTPEDLVEAEKKLAKGNC
jgi:3-deoxy-manno-octulosonate cytidylyltransferase (CMP-KDO synthetase)